MSNSAEAMEEKEVFVKFYADLRKKVNPNDIAADLRAKHLISDDEHDDITNMMLGEKVRMDHLLRAVQKAIHIKPENFHIFLDVLANAGGGKYDDLVKEMKDSQRSSIQTMHCMDTEVKLRILTTLSVGECATVKGDTFKFSEGDAPGVVMILEPMSVAYNYFECEIINQGEKCKIGIGVGERKYPLDEMPGWIKNGIGYHADDGNLFYQDGYGTREGQTCSVGDIMGCGVDFETNVGYGYVHVFFTRNGQQVTKPIKMRRPIHGFYPLIGMHSPGEKVRYLGHCRRMPDSIAPRMIVSPWQRSNGVLFLDDGLTVEYCGDELETYDEDVGAFQSLNYHMYRGKHHFEMKVLNAGKGGMVAIGLASSTYPLHIRPGLEAESISYHANHKLVYKNDTCGDALCVPDLSNGDIIGCGILCADTVPLKRECIFFVTVNHQVVGFDQCLIPEGGFYPLFATSSYGTKLRVTFDTWTSEIESALERLVPREIKNVREASEAENNCTVA